MTGRADPLAVLRRDARQAFQHRFPDPNDLSRQSDQAIADVAALVEAARALMAGLDNTSWSSWQTTAHFAAEQKAMRAALEPFGESP